MTATDGSSRRVVKVAVVLSVRSTGRGVVKAVDIFM
jgi:hypothetical protein